MKKTTYILIIYSFSSQSILNFDFSNFNFILDIVDRVQFQLESGLGQNTLESPSSSNLAQTSQIVRRIITVLR